MSDTTPRLGLPLLAAGQSQKEITHNEALALLDQLAVPVVESGASNVPPSAPVGGQAWIVGKSPSGAWTGRAEALAIWTAGGWRFVAPIEGMRLWSRADGSCTWRTPTAWATGAVVAAPAGGTTIDAECRAAVAALLAGLRAQGILRA